MSVAGLILAAGESRRMGSPKALLEFQGETFLDRWIGLLARHCSPVIAVLGGEADRIRAGIHRAGDALLIGNPEFRLGQITSMQCGLRAVPLGSAGVLFTLVDHPAVQPGTIDALLEHSPAPFRVPRFQGRRGHPIYFSSALIPEFLALPNTQGAREVLARHENEIAYLDVDDAGVLADVDTPDAYRRLLAGELR